MVSFQLAGLDPAPFEPLFGLSDDELSHRGFERVFATARFGFPCRVSLEDANEGEELLLLPFVHQPAASPYHASGPIFVRRGAKRRVVIDAIPDYVARRLISLRAYDVGDRMIDADVCEGSAVRDAIERLLADGRVGYLHLHNARRGCFSCRVDRVQAKAL